MQAWQIWMVIGIICVIIEIFDPAFFFLSLGAAAIITGLLSFAVKSTVWQIIIFAVLSFLAFLSMRKLGKKVLAVTDKDTNVYALKGVSGTVTEAIPEQGKGRVKIGGEEWPALEKDNHAIEQGIKIKVIDIDGNKLIVEKLNQDS